MAKKKKKKKQESVLNTQKAELKESVRNFNWLLAGLTVLVTVIVYLVYRVAIYFEFYPIFLIYFALALASGITYAVYNRGIMGKLPKMDELNEAWSDEQKTAFLDEAGRRKKKSRILLVIFTAFVLTFLIEAVLSLLDNMGIDYM